MTNRKALVPTENQLAPFFIHIESCKWSCRVIPLSFLPSLWWWGGGGTGENNEISQEFTLVCMVHEHGAQMLDLLPPLGRGGGGGATLRREF
jgi:hypothetical protein